MSDAFDRGRNLEREIAAIIRKKTGVLAVRDSRSGANWHRRSDIFTELPIHVEAKDHETIKVKEWFRQADAAASFNQLAVLAFRCDEFILATVEFHKLIDLYVELADLRAQLEDFRTTPLVNSGLPEIPVSSKPELTSNENLTDKLTPAVDDKVNRGGKTCRNGHLADDWNYCMQKGCPYSRGYVKKKGKK